MPSEKPIGDPGGDEASRSLADLTDEELAREVGKARRDVDVEERSRIIRSVTRSLPPSRAGDSETPTDEGGSKAPV